MHPAHSCLCTHTWSSFSFPVCGMYCSPGRVSAGLESEERTDLGNLVQIYLRNATFDFTFGAWSISSLFCEIFFDQTFRTKWEVIQLRKSAAHWEEKKQVMTFYNPQWRHLGWQLDSESAWAPLTVNFGINYGVANSGSTSHLPNLYHLSTQHNLFFWKSGGTGEGTVTVFD